MIDKIHKELQHNPEVSLKSFYKKYYENVETALQKEDVLFQSYLGKHFKGITNQAIPSVMYIKVDRYIPRFNLVHLPVYTFSSLGYSKFEKTSINRAFFNDKLMRFVEVTEEEFNNAAELHKRTKEDIDRLINDAQISCVDKK